MYKRRLPPVLFVSCCFLILFSCRKAENEGERTLQKPNIVIINVDDLGWKDLGYMGSPYYETPNIDKLTGEGMVFYHAYAPASNCAPSRAAMISGLNTPKHGVYTVSSSARGDERTRKLIPVDNQIFLPDSIYTLPQFMKDQGYVTGTFGKWHITKDPKKQGFDVNVGGSHFGHPGKDGYFSPYNIDNIEDGPEGEYLTDRLTQEALKFIEQNKDTTFFLYMPFYSVHTPIMGKPELVSKFEQKVGSEGHDRADYAAMIASVDENVGRLLNAIEGFGLKDRTLLIFTSDNGGIREISKQDPLRAGKGSYYEGGIRVPMIMRWPGKITAGSRSDFPVSQMDFFPTLHKILEPNQPLPDNFDGMDLHPLFQEKIQDERTLFWHFPIYLEAYDPKQDDAKDPVFRTRPGSVIRKGEWKLHQYFEDGDLELYNLSDDPGERNNLASMMPEKTEELLNTLVEWRTKHNAPVPEMNNPAYNADYEKTLINKIME
ncbi:MAG: sulfatase [Cyclobacteriaceae bacterium]|nr:sulfatase [Cyclobacteriaceae bacterium]